MTSTPDLWRELVSHKRQQMRIEQIRSLVAWDQQTGMPTGGEHERSEQLAYLMGLEHAQVVDSPLGDCVAALGERQDELDPQQRAGLRNIEREWRRAAAVSAALVERIGRLQGQGFGAWMKAREAKDASVLAPVLTELLAATRERSEAIDPARDAYEVLVDEFDPGWTVAALDETFTRLRAGLAGLLDAIRGAEPMPELQGTFDAPAQLALATEVAKALGFDLERGRIDQSEHPFTCSVAPGDVRFTTKVVPADLLMMLGGTIHETGHALYEQGLPTELMGTGVGAAASMGLHESQSRFWENTIGRSLPFCHWLQGPMRSAFGAAAPDADLLYRASNRVEAGLTRITADEVTYNLHIAIRFELERRLFSGELSVADLPDAWNEAYRTHLGVDVPHDTAGVLQDVHWSGGAFGYFPSYTLGNLYAASFAQQLQADMPDLWSNVEAGRFEGVVAWLRDRVHRHGHRWEAPELVRRVVGDRDAVDDLVAHLWARHGALHGVV